VSSRASETLGALDAALDMVAALCSGEREWMMSIPAREDHDPDLVIGGAIRRAKHCVEALARNEPDGHGSTPLEKTVITYLRAMDDWMRLVDSQPNSAAEKAAFRVVDRYETKLRTLVLPRVEAETNYGQ
jgi:hypothetical protein